jgi:hypothetical protein
LTGPNALLPLDDEEVLPDYMASTPRELSDERISEVFLKFDHDNSGDLSKFELSNAVTELLGKPPTTTQVAAMLEVAHSNGLGLSLSSFAFLVRNFDWEANELQEGLGADVYEVSFPNPSLGFVFRFVPERGIVVVSNISASSLEGGIGVNDTLLAVNGAPLGFISDPKVRKEGAAVSTGAAFQFKLTFFCAPAGPLSNHRSFGTASKNHF